MVRGEKAERMKRKPRHFENHIEKLHILSLRSQETFLATGEQQTTTIYSNIYTTTKFH